MDNTRYINGAYLDTPDPGRDHLLNGVFDDAWVLTLCGEAGLFYDSDGLNRLLKRTPTMPLVCGSCQASEFVPQEWWEDREGIPAE